MQSLVALPDATACLQVFSTPSVKIRQVWPAACPPFACRVLCAKACQGASQESHIHGTGCAFQLRAQFATLALSLLSLLLPQAG